MCGITRFDGTWHLSSSLCETQFAVSFSTVAISDGMNVMKQFFPWQRAAFLPPTTVWTDIFTRVNRSRPIGALGAALRLIRSLRQISSANHRLQDFPWGNSLPSKKTSNFQPGHWKSVVFLFKLSFIPADFCSSWFLFKSILYSSLFYTQLFSSLFLFESVLP